MSRDPLVEVNSGGKFPPECLHKVGLLLEVVLLLPAVPNLVVEAPHQSLLGWRKGTSLSVLAFCVLYVIHKSPLLYTGVG